MSGGWQVGDLALCVAESPNPWSNHPQVVRGSISEVEAVVWDAVPGLVLKGRYSKHSTRDHRMSRFRKVTPPKADEFDREVIEAMGGAPILPRVPLPVDVTDAERFPEIARALAHAAALRRNAKPEGNRHG